MEFILNAGLGIGVFIFLLLLSKKHKNQSDFLFLGWILIVLGQIAFYEVTLYQFKIEGLWAILLFGLPMLGAPLLFLYILSLTRQHVSWKTAISHLGIYLIYITLFFMLFQKNKLPLTAINGYFEIAENQPLHMQFYAIPLAISGLVYCIWDLILLRKHKQTIANLFSFEEKINLNWLRYVVYSYLVLFLFASFLIFGATQFQLLPVKNAFALVGICLSFMLLAFGFYGFRQTAIFSTIGTQIIPTADSKKSSSGKPSYSKSGLTPAKIESLANRLTEYMRIKKPFLDENLSLALLASQTEITQPQLSQIINQHLKINFYDFVNRYRIEEAKQKLSSSDFDHLSVLGIAFDCGFKSKSSFNRYFKKYTGVSPSTFKKKEAK